MKAYYLLSVLSYEDKEFFFDSIKAVKKPEDIDTLIQNRYYRVDKTTSNTTYNSITLETWIFIKQIWLKYKINPTEINWVYKKNMIIINDDLWLSKGIGNGYTKVSGEKNIYFFTSRYGFTASFWALWEKLSQINDTFPTLVVPNKEISLIRNEKIKFIANAYEKREEFMGDFMLPLMYTRNIVSIREMLELWKKETGKIDMIVKKSWGTDNGKHITLINVDEYIENEQRIDYLFLKYISYTNEFNTDLFFTEYFETEKEFRLYYSKNLQTGDYKLYSVKRKENLTQKEEIFLKANLRTGQQIQVKWHCLDIVDVPEELNVIAKHVMKQSKIDVGVIEFIRLPDGRYRFLEINCLGGSMMFSGKDETNIKSLISDWWNELFFEYVDNKTTLSKSKK